MLVFVQLVHTLVILPKVARHHGSQSQLFEQNQKKKSPILFGWMAFVLFRRIRQKQKAEAQQTKEKIRERTYRE